MHEKTKAPHALHTLSTPDALLLLLLLLLLVVLLPQLLPLLLLLLLFLLLLLVLLLTLLLLLLLLPVAVALLQYFVTATGASAEASTVSSTGELPGRKASISSKASRCGSTVTPSAQACETLSLFCCAAATAYTSPAYSKT